MNFLSDRSRGWSLLGLLLLGNLSSLSVADGFPAQAPRPWKSTAPVVLSWRRPEYPPDLLAEQRSGNVSVRIVVNDLGVVAEAQVLQSFDPRAEQAALNDIRQWKFRPALVADLEAPCSLDVNIPFRLPISTDPLPVLPTPPEMPVEVKALLPKPIFTPDPDYPPELADQRIGGSVQMMLLVNSKGNVVDHQLLSAGQPGFGRAAAEAVTFWLFKPAHQGLLDIPALYEADLNFTPR